jgi:hypothetical protein
MLQVIAIQMLEWSVDAAVRGIRLDVGSDHGDIAIMVLKCRYEL